MQLAAWLDVALEGGVVELERALADYRTLRRLLSGDWSARSLRVAETAEHVRLHRVGVEAAIERAARRARVDAAAKPGLELAERVERARTELEERVAALSGRRGSFGVQMEWLFELANEAADAERSLRRFRVERATWTVAMVSLGFVIPVSSWLVASFGGEIGTVISPEVLAEPAALGLLLSLLLMAVISGVRLDSWSWLGVRSPLIVRPAFLSGLTALISMVGLGSLSMRNSAPFMALLAAFTFVGAAVITASWWRNRHLPLPAGQN